MGILKVIASIIPKSQHKIEQVLVEKMSQTQDIYEFIKLNIPYIDPASGLYMRLFLGFVFLRWTTAETAIICCLKKDLALSIVSNVLSLSVKNLAKSLNTDSITLENSFLEFNASRKFPSLDHQITTKELAASIKEGFSYFMRQDIGPDVEQLAFIYYQHVFEHTRDLLASWELGIL